MQWYACTVAMCNIEVPNKWLMILWGHSLCCQQNNSTNITRMITWPCHETRIPQMAASWHNKTNIVTELAAWPPHASQLLLSIMQFQHRRSYAPYNRKGECMFATFPTVQQHYDPAAQHCQNKIIIIKLIVLISWWYYFKEQRQG